MQSKVNEMKTRFQKLQQEEEEAKNALKQKNFEYENDFKDMENQLSRRYHRILELEKYKKLFEDSNKHQSPIKKDQYGKSQSSRKSDQHLHRSCSSCIKLQDQIAKQSSQLSQKESKIQELESEKSKYKKLFEETITNYTSKCNSKQSKSFDVNYQNLDMDISDEDSNITKKNRQSNKKDQYGISHSSRKSDDENLNKSCLSCIKLQDQNAKESSQFESRIKELEKQKLDYFNSLEEISQENEWLKSNDGKYNNRIRFYGSSN